MRVRLLAFASAAEALGRRSQEIELPEGSTVGDLVASLETSAPALAALRGRLALALDGRLADETEELVEGCEIALLPPVSGGRGTAPAHLTRAPIDDPGALLAEVADSSCGAHLAFVGAVRATSAGRTVTRLAYEAHETMAEAALARICRELGSESRRVAILHRLGEVAVGETSVVIAVAAPHRAAAYETSRAALERLKREVPIWKREHYSDGSARWCEEEELRRPTDGSAAGSSPSHSGA